MSGVISYQHGLIVESIGELNRVIAVGQGLLSRLGEIKQSMSAVWRGSANESFVATCDNLSKILQQTIDNANQLIQKLKQANESMQSTDQQVAAVFG